MIYLNQIIMNTHMIKLVFYIRKSARNDKSFVFFIIGFLE